VTPPTAASRIYRWITLPAATAVWVLGALALHDLLWELYDTLPPEVIDEAGDLLSYYEVVPYVVLLVFMLFYPFWILLVRDALPLLFAQKRRRLTRSRKKMAALLSRRYELGPGGVELLMQNDQEMGTYLERFLHDHNVPHTPVLYDDHGKYLFRSPQKVQTLAAALLRSIGKGHDNELFVLLVDLVELEGELGPLLRAVKVARARHHQVMLICPWPPDLEPPGAAPPPSPLEPVVRTAAARGRGRRGRVPDPMLSVTELRGFLHNVLGHRYHVAYHRLRRTFARLQVPVVCAGAGEPVQLVLDRVDRLRSVRRKR
jgi:hypothetical protein